MSHATDLDQISSALHLWQRYDRSVKADLSSTAIESGSEIFFVDPIPLKPEVIGPLVTDRAVAGVLITNANHRRAATDFAEAFATRVFAHSITCAACELSFAQVVAADQQLAADLCVVEIEGAAPGEVALYHRRDGGAIIVGDALINFEPYGFALLPPKYCGDAKQMRQSLRRLLDYKFERMLFAHGMPLLASARTRLEQLLNNAD